MSAIDDYPLLAFRAGLIVRERPTPALYSERTELCRLLSELDALRSAIHALTATIPKPTKELNQ